MLWENKWNIGIKNLAWIGDGLALNYEVKKNCLRKIGAHNPLE